jgi:hypothetical protein
VGDPQNRDVPGTVELLTLDGALRYATFRFDSALSSEGTYSVDGLAPSPAQSFVKGGPFVDTPLAPNVTGVEGIQLEPQDKRCCVGTQRALLPPGTAPCLAVVSLQVAQVSVGAGFALDDSSSRQYLYRATLTAPELIVSPYWLPAIEAAAHAWTLATKMPADELCYRVEAYRLSDGNQSVIAEGCAPAPAGALALTGPSEQDVAAALDVSACLTAPAGLTAAWCEVNRMACMDHAKQNPIRMDCDAAKFDTTCAAYPHSDKSLADLVEHGDDAVDSAGSGGRGAGSSATAAGESAAGGRASPPKTAATANNSKGSRGCNAAPRAAATRRRAIPVLLVLFVTLAVARRMRRRAAS